MRYFRKLYLKKTITESTESQSPATSHQLLVRYISSIEELPLLATKQKFRRSFPYAPESPACLIINWADSVAV